MHKLFYILTAFLISVFVMAGEIPGNRKLPGPVTIGSSTGVSIDGNNGVLTVESVGNTNNNKLTVNLETSGTETGISGNDTTIKVSPNSDNIFTTVSNFNGTATYSNDVVEASKSFGTAFTVLADTNDYFYVGKLNKFEKIYFDLSVVGAGITLVAQYSKGGGTWGTLTVTDGTTALSKDGTISFTPPADWATDTVNSVDTTYWVRLSASGLSTPPTANLVTPEDVGTMSIWANYNDALPAIGISKAGNITLGYWGAYFTNGKFTLPDTLEANGTTYFGSNVIMNTQTVAYANDGHISRTKPIIKVSGNGGAVILDTNPAIDNGLADGQILTIIGGSDSNTVTIVDNCNVQLAGGASWVGGLGDVLCVVYDSTVGDWLEISRSNN